MMEVIGFLVVVILGAIIMFMGTGIIFVGKMFDGDHTLPGIVVIFVGIVLEYMAYSNSPFELVVR